MLDFKESFLIDTRVSKSIVFDVDGTLLNSEPMIRSVAFEVMRTYLTSDAGRIFEEHISPITAQCFGNSEDIFCAKVISYLREHALASSRAASMSNEEFLHKFTGDRTALYLEYCAAGKIKPMPGAVQLVRNAFERFGPLAINTGSPEMLSYPMLVSAFRDHFDVDVVFPKGLRTFVTDLANGFGKPNPDGYIRAARLLGHAPWDLMAVVDRGNDCISALRAQYQNVLVVPEDGDIGPLMAPAGKHSLLAFLETHPVVARDEIRRRYKVVSSLEAVGFYPVRVAA